MAAHSENMTVSLSFPSSRSSRVFSRKICPISLGSWINLIDVLPIVYRGILKLLVSENVFPPTNTMLYPYPCRKFNFSNQIILPRFCDIVYRSAEAHYVCMMRWWNHRVLKVQSNAINVIFENMIRMQWSVVGTLNYFMSIEVQWFIVKLWNCFCLTLRNDIFSFQIDDIVILLIFSHWNFMRIYLS